MSDTDEIQLVRSADNMADDVFAKHMNSRHRESLGGLEALDLDNCGDYVILCWRKFHNALHRLNMVHISHEHGPYRRADEDGQGLDTCARPGGLRRTANGLGGIPG